LRCNAAWKLSKELFVRDGLNLERPTVDLLIHCRSSSTLRNSCYVLAEWRFVLVRLNVAYTHIRVGPTIGRLWVRGLTKVVCITVLTGNHHWIAAGLLQLSVLRHVRQQFSKVTESAVCCHKTYMFARHLQPVHCPRL